MIKTREIDIEKEPVEIGPGIYWVGYADENRGLHCNPYLIVEGDEAILIDGGNRDDFSNVMLKILRTGLKPSQITKLIYQHYDPDLCGSLPQLEAIINNKDLKIISHIENNVFINYYSTKTEKLDFEDLDNHFDFATGRRLKFYATPYAHQPGSFVTYDTQTKILFSSDLFGSYDTNWRLKLNLDELCTDCYDLNNPSCRLDECPIKNIINFHRAVMPCNRALSNALDIIEKLDVEIIASQHGSIICTKKDMKTVTRHLRLIKNVGIDFLLGEESK